MSNDLNFPKGAYLFREGETARYAYVLKSGAIEIVKMGVDGETVLTELEEPNQIFGEMAIIDGAPRSAGARAKTDAVVSQVDKPNFLDYVTKNPQAAHNIMIRLSSELRHVNDELSHVKANTVVQDVDLSEGLEITELAKNEDIDDTDSIYRTSPSKPLIYSVAIILILFFTFGIFSFAFELDTTVSARGKFITKVPNVDVQATSSAIVKKVMIERGEILEKGEIVAILDETNAQTNLVQNEETLSAIVDRLQRIKLEQQYIENSTEVKSDSNLPSILQDILRKRVGQYRSKIASFKSRINKLQKETDAARQEITSASKTVGISEQQVRLKSRIERAREELYNRKSGSLLSYLQAKDATLAAERALYQSRNVFAQKKAALAAKLTDLSTLRSDKEEFTASWSSKLGEERAKEEERRVQLSQEAIKLKRDMSNVEVRAPVAGVVLDVPAITSGSIVREGDVIATLVRTNQPLSLEVDVTPKDISDARLGAEVSVKLDALPFQQYGDLSGTLSYLSQDTYDGSLDGEPGAFYRGRIDISAVELKKVPSNFKLTSGMTASADMKVGKRRIIDYLLFPIIKGLSKSFREPD